MARSDIDSGGPRGLKGLKLDDSFVVEYNLLRSGLGLVDDDDDDDIKIDRRKVLLILFVESCIAGNRKDGDDVLVLFDRVAKQHVVLVAGGQ
jgi:hypothetical protein